MKVVFLSSGARELALEAIAKSNHDVVGVITPVPNNKNSRFSDVILTAHRFGIPVYTVTEKTVSGILNKLDYDILLSCGFGYIIDNKAISSAKVLAINVHPTLLPKYRGFRSGPYVVINNEKYSGITIHILNEEMDKGDIIIQYKYKLSIFDTTKSIYRKAREKEPLIIIKALNMIEAKTYKLIKQDENKATTYNKIRTPKDSFIDWNKPLKDLYNEIRACDPVDYPAFFYINNEKVCIRLWRVNKKNSEFDMI